MGLGDVIEIFDFISIAITHCPDLRVGLDLGVHFGLLLALGDEEHGHYAK